MTLSALSYGRPLVILAALLLGAACAARVPIVADASGSTDLANLNEAGRPAGSVQLAPDREEDLVYKVLVAEFAGRRGMLELSLTKYLEVARESGDARAAERAVRIAIYSRDFERGVEAAKLWSRLDESNVEATQVLSALLLRSNQVEQATRVLRELIAKLEAKAPGDGYKRVSELLAREKNKKLSIRIMRDLVAEAKDDAEAVYALARLLGRSGELGEAASLLGELTTKSPEEERFVVLYAQILRRQGEHDKALQIMAEALERRPQSALVRLTYARLLVDARKFEEARSQFEILVAENSGDSDVRYALAVILLQLEDYEAAREQLKLLEFNPQRRYAANYYLGQIAESDQDYAAALNYYGRVDRGEHRLNAQIRAAAVMANQGQLERARGHLQVLRSTNSADSVRLFRAEAELLAGDDRLEEAMTVYDQALTLHDGNGDLLYARAMLAEKLGRLKVLERDLRDILSREPNNADALNALGYTLADRTNRVEEAHDLIRRAHELKPDDHYIVDSLGWVMYRLGRYEEAVAHLRRAFALRPDPEIAAHLGEVLWVMGEKEAAEKVWNEALETTPGDARLLDVKRRFGL